MVVDLIVNSLLPFCVGFVFGFFVIGHLIFVCLNKIQKNKERKQEKNKKINQINSSMGVQCVAPETCMLRHTTSCNNCKNNIGKYEDKNFYEPR